MTVIISFSHNHQHYIYRKSALFFSVYPFAPTLQRATLLGLLNFSPLLKEPKEIFMVDMETNVGGLSVFRNFIVCQVVSERETQKTVEY